MSCYTFGKNGIHTHLLLATSFNDCCLNLREIVTSVGILKICVGHDSGCGISVVNKNKWNCYKLTYCFYKYKYRFLKKKTRMVDKYDRRHKYCFYTLYWFWWQDKCSALFDIKNLLSTQIGMTGNVGTGNILSCAPTKSLS